jgi:hypothetical protein
MLPMCRRDNLNLQFPAIVLWGHNNLKKEWGEGNVQKASHCAWQIH